MPFVVERKVDLAFLGEGWAGASLAFNAMSFRETKQFASMNISTDGKDNSDNEKNFDLIATILKEKFVSGKAWDGSTLVDLKADDVLDLPVEAINKSVEILVGAVSPN